MEKDKSMHPDIEEILISEDEIQTAVKRMGKEITDDYQGQSLIVIGILKGAFAFMSDLIQEIELPVEIDFMDVSSYGMGTTSTGEVRILKDIDIQVEGRNVLLVEDIVDTGLTLSYLMKVMESRGAKDVRVASLLSKPSRRERAVSIDYIGYEVEDKFVVGYGIDFAERYRNLPYIACLKPSVYEEK